VQAEHVAPFVKEGADRLFVRWGEDQGQACPVIAVKKGFFLRGLIEPVRSVLTTRFCETLENIAAQARQVVGGPADEDGGLI
jgi:hypothetical protein